MKTAIVYYSQSGNTAYVAKRIAEKTGADLIEIAPDQTYPDKGFKKFLWGGKSAVMGEAPKLLPYEFDAAKYDQVIIGTPVWASNYVPPLRTFLIENKGLAQKKLSVFLCFMGGGADKALDKLKKDLHVHRFEEELILIDPLAKRSEEKDAEIDAFCEKLLA